MKNLVRNFVGTFSRLIPSPRYFPIRKILIVTYNFLKGNQDPLFKSVIVSVLNFFQYQVGKNGSTLVLDRRSFGTNFVLGNHLNLEFVKNWHIGFHGPLNASNFEYFCVTIKLIRKYYGLVSISLTQTDVIDNESILNFLNQFHVKLIQVSDPGIIEDPANKNLLRQIRATEANIRIAAEKDKKYFLKYRVDQRLTDPYFLFWFDRTIQLFPSGSRQSESRIFGTSLNTFVIRPCGLSDMIMFGATPDMKKYWRGASKDEYLQSREKLAQSNSDPMWSSFQIPEQWLSARYMLNFVDTLEDSDSINTIFWSIYAGVIDSTTIGQIWNRSGTYIQTSFTSYPWFKGYGPNNLRELHFTEWLTFLYYNHPSNKYYNYMQKHK
jgi:hypothetical protein